MADNTLQNGTSNIATDDVAGVHYQIVKVGHGLADAAPVHTSATNPLPTVALQNSVVSTVNSSAAALLLGVAFVGTAEDVTDYSHIVVSVFASHDSAVDGLQLQQSHDNVNWDFTDSYSIPATTGKTFSVAVLCKFFRVMYTNGGVMQTAFRLSTIYSKHAKKGSSVRAQDGRGNDNDFEETLAYQMSFDGTNWNRQRGTIANGLLADVSRIVAALPAGANVIGTVNHPAITKGTQGATGITTQDLKDAGRNARSFMLDAYTAAPAAEAVQSVVQWYGNAAVAGTTQPAVVPAGKTLRLTSWSMTTKALAAAGSAVLRIRANTAGLGVLASPLVWSSEVGSKAAVAGLLDGITGVFPDGFEFPAGTGLSFSMAGYNATGVLTLMGVTRFQVHGYEY